MFIPVARLSWLHGAWWHVAIERLWDRWEQHLGVHKLMMPTLEEQERRLRAVMDRWFP
jgi:hypothetical protein